MRMDDALGGGDFKRALLALPVARRVEKFNPVDESMTHISHRT